MSFFYVGARFFHTARTCSHSSTADVAKVLRAALEWRGGGGDDVHLQSWFSPFGKTLSKTSQRFVLLLIEEKWRKMNVCRCRVNSILTKEKRTHQGAQHEPPGRTETEDRGTMMGGRDNNVGDPRATTPQPYVSFLLPRAGGEKRKPKQILATPSRPWLRVCFNPC